MLPVGGSGALDGSIDVCFSGGNCPASSNSSRLYTTTSSRWEARGSASTANGLGVWPSSGPGPSSPVYVASTTSDDVTSLRCWCWRTDSCLTSSHTSVTLAEPIE